MSDDDKKKQGDNNHDPSKLVIENIMRTQDGRDFMYNYLQSCTVFESIFDKDPVQTGYNSGMRDAGLQLERQLKEAAPAYYLKMIEENI